MATNNALNITGVGVVVYAGAGVWTASTFAQFSLLIGGASNAVSSVGPLTNGQLLIGSTGVAPVAASLTAGSGITITPGAGSITIAAAGFAAWVVVTTTSQAIAVGSSEYFANNAALVTFTLPATSSVGDTIRISGMGAGGWKIAQNASQQIFFGNTATTAGTGGSLASTLQYDTIYLVANVANTSWVVQSAIGNITVV